MIDHAHWDLVEEFMLEQAACLWCEVRPSTNGLETLDRRQKYPATVAIEQMLKSEIDAGHLKAVRPGERAPFIGSNPILHRDDLKRLAIAKGACPRFLFPGESAAAEGNATHSPRTEEPDDEGPSYRGPFVALILRAEKHFGESAFEIKSQEIQDWLRVQGPKIDPNWSESKTKAMATFLRHPDQQVGGAKRAKGRTIK